MTIRCDSIVFCHENLYQISYQLRNTTPHPLRLHTHTCTRRHFQHFKRGNSSSVKLKKMIKNDKKNNFFFPLPLFCFKLAHLSSINLVSIFRCSSPPDNPVYTGRVDPSTLTFTLPSPTLTYISLLFSSRFIV